MKGYRETKQKYAIFLFPNKHDSLLFVITISAAIHLLFLLLLTLISAKTQNLSAYKKIIQDPIHFKIENKKNFANTNFDNQNKDLASNLPKNRSGGILTDLNPNSKSKILVPEDLASVDKRIDKNPKDSLLNYEKIKKDKPLATPKNPLKSKNFGMKSFLPSGNQSYLDKIRGEALKPRHVYGDSGDIPISAGTPEPYQGTIIKSRFEYKDLSLLQFSMEFKERFSGYWNMKERILPPESELRPGEVIFFKLYIRKDGSLQKVENLNRKKTPLKDFSGVDNIVREVLEKVFPMTMPPSFDKSIVTEIIAIQIIGLNSAVQYFAQ